jgi:TolA-binding protein
MAPDSETRKNARAIYRILSKTYPNVKEAYDKKLKTIK